MDERYIGITREELAQLEQQLNAYNSPMREGFYLRQDVPGISPNLCYLRPRAKIVNFERKPVWYAEIFGIEGAIEVDVGSTSHYSRIPDLEIVRKIRWMQKNLKKQKTKPTGRTSKVQKSKAATSSQC